MEDLSVLNAPSSSDASKNLELARKAAIAAVEELLQLPWVENVYATDARWRKLLPESAESLATVAERLLRSIDDRDSRPRQQELFPTFAALGLRTSDDVVAWCGALRQQYDAIDAMHVDALLSDLLERSVSLHGLRKEALLSRLGWGGRPPRTLEEAGQILGVTRERIRQIENKVRKRLPPGPTVAPALERALKLLDESSPIAAVQAAKLLKARSLSSIEFAPESVIAAASDLGLDCPIEISETKGVRMVVRAASAGHVGRILRLARKTSGAAGVVNCMDIALKISQETAISCKADDVRSVLTASPHFRGLSGYWFWATDLPAGRNRVVNICRKMLSVTSPISTRKLRDGLRREFTFRNLTSSGRLNLRVPPTAVLREFLSDHPDFKVDEHDDVRPIGVLDYRLELGESDRVLVDVLRSSPSMVLDRQSLLLGCVERGILVQTANTDLTYSCVIEHLDTNIWTLRGANVNPAAVEALRRANALRPKERRVRDFGWAATGELWIAVIVPATVQTFVFNCPGGARSFVAGHKFQAITHDRMPCGTIGVTDDGQVYGFGPFMEISGADEGDLVVVEFDLLKHSARLLLGDEELLESFGGD